VRVKMHNAENRKLERLFFLTGDMKEKADNRQQIQG